MAEETAIQWADATLNLWWGCTKVSDGCKFCYAEHLSDTRYKKGAWGPRGSRREVKSWRSTLEKVSRRAKAEGRRLKVFCSSMSDVFEGAETCGGVDSENWRLICRLRFDLFAEIVKHPELDFLLLTKRPRVARVLLGAPEFWLEVNAALCRDAFSVLPGGLGDYVSGRKTLQNLWLGTSVENQEQADERIPHLLGIPAAVRFLSCEPLLGRVDLQYSCFNGADSLQSLEGIHWVICGGESGPNARPMHPDWARSLRDQCQAAGVPFHFKQWGEWLPWMDFLDVGVEDSPEASRFRCAYLDEDNQWEIGFSDWQDELPDDTMGRVGKTKAGRLLDGREWNEFPEV